MFARAYASNILAFHVDTFLNVVGITTSLIMMTVLPRKVAKKKKLKTQIAMNCKLIVTSHQYLWRKAKEPNQKRH